MKTTENKPATTRKQVRAIAKKTEAANNNVTIIQPETKEVKKVKISFRVEQCGKNPFTMHMETEAPENKVTVSGLASKTAFALVDALYLLVQKALQAKETHGYYLTSFRPKAVFKVTIVTDNNINFYALNTKGVDSIRMVKAGKIISRATLVEKMNLLATSIEASKKFAEIINFENEVETALLTA